MRLTDIFSILFLSAIIGLIISFVLLLIIDNQTLFEGNFANLWTTVSLFSSPIVYFVRGLETKCPSCKKRFSISNTGQETLANYVEYKTETVSENGNRETRSVPYNCRRYLQYKECDSCGHAFSSEEVEKNKG